MIAAAGEAEPAVRGHVPAVTVLTSAAVIEWLEAGDLLAPTLFRIQAELQGRGAVELRTGADLEAEPAALAIRASALELATRGRLPAPGATVGVDGEGTILSGPLPHLARRAAALIGAAAQGEGMPLDGLSHPSFLEYMHIEERRTTFPSSETNPQPGLEVEAI